MDKYYDMSKGVKAEDIVDDFLAEEALENVEAMEDEGWECVGIYDLKDWENGGREKAIEDMAAVLD